MSKILFLDFDGVLLPFYSYWDLDTQEILRKPEFFTYKLAERTPAETIKSIKYLCENDKREIVVISTWRYLVPGDTIMDYLDACELGKYVCKKCPIAAFNKQFANKKDDIEKWLSLFPTEDWIAIDDHHLRLPEGKQIKPDPLKGYLG